MALLKKDEQPVAWCPPAGARAGERVKDYPAGARVPPEMKARIEALSCGAGDEQWRVNQRRESVLLQRSSTGGRATPGRKRDPRPRLRPAFEVTAEKKKRQSARESTVER